MHITYYDIDIYDSTEITFNSIPEYLLLFDYLSILVFLIRIPKIEPKNLLNQLNLYTFF